MRTFFLSFTLCVMMVLQVVAQDPSLEWVVQIGGPLNDRGRNVKVDQSGNILMTGSFSGSAVCTFPGGTTLDLDAIGSSDAFIQKLGPDGSHIWTKQCGGNGYAMGQEVLSDPDGNIYVMGNFSGTVDFDPGPGTFNLTYAGDVYIGTATFILKLDATGNFLWAKQTQPVNGGTNGFVINRDAGENLIITGYFGGKVDFDPGPGTAICMPQANQQIFVLKLDPNGNFLWVNELGGSGDDYGYCVTTDAGMNIYTVGSFKGTVDFDPSKKGVYTLTSIGSTDAFIQKSDPSGKFLWAKQIGGNGSVVCQEITINNAGELVFSGWGCYLIDFDPGPGVYSLYSSSSVAFIEKLDATGNFIWVKQVEGVGTETFWSGTWGIEADAGGNIYTTGYFGGSADFDPSPTGTYIKTCIDTVDCFVLKLDGSGNFQWAQQIGGENGYNCGLGIDTDPYGNVYTTGFFNGDVSGFDPANPEFYLHSNGYRDSFLQKLSQGPVCFAPGGLIATNISYYSATLNWNAAAGAMAYNVRYGVNGSGNWTVVSGVTGTSLPVTGLSPMTAYEFHVQTNCGEGQSQFSPSSVFTTPGLVCTDTYEPNENLGAAKTISAGTDIGAKIASSVDNDWFKFSNNNKKKNIMITLTNLPANYDVALYNSAGQQIGISENTGTADELIIYNTNQQGTYYIHVYGNSGAFEPNLCYLLNATISSSGFRSLDDDAGQDVLQAELEVYPNPVSTKLYIEYTSLSDAKTTLRLITLSGQIKVNKEIQAIEGFNHYSLDLSEIPNGCYFIEVKTNDQRIFRKVVVSK